MGISEITRERSWNAWAGTRRDAEAIFALAGELIQEPRDAEDDDRLTTWRDLLELRKQRVEAGRTAVTEAEAESHAAVAKLEELKSAGADAQSIRDAEQDVRYLSRLAEVETDSLEEQERNLKGTAEDLARREADFAERWASEVTVGEKVGDTKYTGDPGRLVDFMDPRTLKSFRLDAPAYYSAKNRVIVSTRARDVSLTVKGSDPTWTAASYSRMVAEIQKGVPWWAFLRSPYFTAVYGFAWTTGFTLAFWQVYAFSPWAAGAGVFVFGGLATWGTALAARYLIPPFEIADQGKKPRGAAGVGIIATIVFELAIGIVVNIITR
jgi:hypothetical protein